MTDHVSVLKADGTSQIFAMQRGFRTEMRRFVLDRITDISGVSGTGVVAEGVEFSDGRAVIRWVVGFKSTAIYDSMDELMDIHGHSGATKLRWIDDGG